MAPNEPAAGISRRKTHAIFVGMLIATFLASLDTTAVSTALPTMAGELGGLDQLPWVLTGYLLGSVAATPLYGKLSDIYGRRPLSLAALGIFGAASVLCAVSQTMTQLVIARGLQGIGGGGLMAMGFIVIGDIFSPRERGRYMAYYTMNFSFSAIVGPLVGGLLVDAASWRWIFGINVPLGLIAAAFVYRNLTFELPKRPHHLDVVGSVLLICAVVCLIVGLAMAGEGAGWTSPLVLALLVTAAGTSVGFVWWERRATEPLLPMRLFRNPTFRILIGGNTIYGLAGMATLAYLPLFFQVTLGESPTRAGLILATMSIAVTVGSYVAGRLTTGTGRYLRILHAAPVLSVVGLAGLLTLHQGQSAAAAIPWLGIVGFSMGLAFPTMTTATQNSLDLGDLGAGTAAINFFRTLGQTVGVGAFGALLTARISSVLTDADTAAGIGAQDLLSTPSEIKQLTPELRDLVEHAVEVATHAIVVAALPIMAILVVAVWFLPELELRTTTALSAQPSTSGRPDTAEGDRPTELS